MVFRLFRDSGLPIILEKEETHTIKTLDVQGRWTELDDYYAELKNSGDLTEIMIEADSMEELKLFLTTIDDTFEFRINFAKKFIAIMDQGRDS
jgi:hypothetical protein